MARKSAELTGSGLYVDYTNSRIVIYKKQNDPYAIAVVSQLLVPRYVAIVTYASPWFTVQS